MPSRWSIFLLHLGRPGHHGISTLTPKPRRITITTGKRTRPRGRTPSPRPRSNPRRQRQNPRRRNGDNGLGSRPNGNNGLGYTIPRRGLSGTTRRPRRPRLKGPIASRNIGDGQVIQVRCWNDAQCASASLPSVAEITTSKWTQGVRPCFVFIRVMAEGDAHECSVGDGTMSRLVAP